MRSLVGCPVASFVHTANDRNINTLEFPPSCYAEMICQRLSRSLLCRRLAISDGRYFIKRPLVPRSAPAATRLIHLPSSDPHQGQSPPCSDANGFLRHHVPEADVSRLVVVKNAPRFAVEEDVRELFEESGLAVYVQNARSYMHLLCEDLIRLVIEPT